MGISKNQNKKKAGYGGGAGGSSRRKKKEKISEEPTDYSFESCRKHEYQKNCFTQFYRKADKNKRNYRDRDDIDKRHEVHGELETYKHKDAIKFAAKSWEWRDSFEEKNVREPLKTCKDSELIPTSCFNDFHNDIRAYYRVIRECEDKYILMACHLNMHGLHRGDLRFVEVNNRTITKDFEFSALGKLFPGDIVVVKKLCKLSPEPLISLPSALEVNQNSPLIWEVAEMRVLKRHLKKDVVFAFMKISATIVKGHNEAMNVILNGTTPTHFERMYTGMAFAPIKLLFQFTEEFSAPRAQILEKASKFSSCPIALGTIYQYELSENLTEQFKVGTNAFKSVDYSPTAEEITELCTQMGQSAVLTLFEGRCDSRVFVVENGSKDDNVIRFFIPNPLKFPTEGLWNCNNRIRIEGTFGKFDALIEVILPFAKERQLQISARVSREAFRQINFRHGTWVVYQKEPKQSSFLEDDFLQNMEWDSNGRKIIETLYGGKSLQKKDYVFDPEKSPKYVFPSYPPVPLNDYQNEYIELLTSEDHPMVLGSSPFGCGKSMTIVMAAIVALEKNPCNQQFLVTQSNYASVNLIEIAKKVQGATELNILRYVSPKNWKELPEHCRTVYDKPRWEEVTLRKLAYGHNSHGEHFDSKHIDLIMAYFIRNPRNFEMDLVCPLFKKHYERNIADIRDLSGRIEYRDREIFKICMQYNRPNLVVITADTLQSICVREKFDASTIQIDEACQVPESTLISIISFFPHANYGLIGDIKQLPPFCEDDLKGKLKEYGIGNTMERAVQEKMFPEAVLRYVYRCHPKITELLSDMFYDGKLISGVKEEQRNKFKTNRPDIWPNPNYPMIVVNNTEKGYRIGTSCGNKAEIILVKQIVESLQQERRGFKLQSIDIGVISFYAAQTAILSDNFRGTSVKCGTVDAFQGSEREVIILCCTNEKVSDFMQMSNRLNVAMSRAKQATIVIGNLNGLSDAKYWRTIVQRAEENGCLVDTSKHPFRVIPEEVEKLKSHPKKSYWIETELESLLVNDPAESRRRQRRGRGGRGSRREGQKDENPEKENDEKKNEESD